MRGAGRAARYVPGTDSWYEPVTAPTCRVWSCSRPAGTALSGAGRPHPAERSTLWLVFVEVELPVLHDVAPNTNAPRTAGTNTRPAARCQDFA